MPTEVSVCMTRMFAECAAVLREKVCPLHYAELTSIALERLERYLRGREFNLTKEDVREKMLIARQHGSFYVPQPHCLACLGEWFPSEQTELFNPTCNDVVIPGNASYSVEAGTELMLRRPYLLTKVVDSEVRWRAAVYGYVVQHHVANYFRDCWPLFWRPPDNEGRWSIPCFHDFKLQLDGVWREVDVMGPKRNGLFGPPKGGGKRGVDLHIAAAINKAGVVVRGFKTGDAMNADFSEWQTQPIVRLIARLNCASLGYDYRLLAKHCDYPYSKK